MKGKIDEYSDSDEDQHDAYLERMKAEGKIREEGNDSDDSDGSGSGKMPFKQLNIWSWCGKMLSLRLFLFRRVFQPWGGR